MIKKFLQREGKPSGAAPGSGQTTGASDETQLTQPLLGRLLVASGVVSEEEMRAAIAEGQESGERLGEVVVRRGWSTDERIAELLAEQWQLPFQRTETIKVDPTAMRRLSAETARALDAAPIGFIDDTLLLAIAEPSRETFDAVDARVGEVAYVVIARSALDALLVSRLLRSDAEASPGADAVASPAVSVPSRFGCGSGLRTSHHVRRSHHGAGKRVGARLRARFVADRSGRAGLL